MTCVCIFYTEADELEMEPAQPNAYFSKSHCRPKDRSVYKIDSSDNCKILFLIGIVVQRSTVVQICHTPSSQGWAKEEMM